MKEILLFTLSTKVDQTLYELGKFGAVDIREITAPSSDYIERTTENLTNTENALSILENYKAKQKDRLARSNYNSKDPKRIVDRIMLTGEIRKQCKHKLDYFNQIIKWYDTWGESINIDDFAYLNTKGIYVRLYRVDEALLKSISDEHCVAIFPKEEHEVPIALFSQDSTERLPIKEEQIPEFSLAMAHRQVVRKERQLEEVDRYLRDQAENAEILEDYLSFLQDRLNTENALEGMGSIEGSIKYLRGFIPHNAVEAFTQRAIEQKWGYQISDPQNPDDVPVYIKNPKWVSMINPVLKFIDIVPGYKEVDVSIYFLIAFALFFAMLVGDAGYGALFLIIAIALRKKLSPQMSLLIYVLSGATIVWGVLSGTYFGSEYIAGLPFFQNLIVEEISSFGVDNISFMMHLSFLIGAIHLTIAHLIRFFQVINSTRALSEIGWIAFVWGLFFVAEKLVLGSEMPSWTMWLFVGGTVLVSFFTREGKNFFSSVLSSIANLPLSLINGFSDIVSYVRLFAVGMATATVASSFNSMIVPAGADMSFVQLIIAAVALFLGHGLNIVLALMAVMVHGIRLNMLEFAGHLGVQFTGKEYKPFKAGSSQPEFEDETSEHLLIKSS